MGFALSAVFAFNTGCFASLVLNNFWHIVNTTYRYCIYGRAVFVLPLLTADRIQQPISSTN